MAEPRIVVIVLTLNQRDKTRACLTRWRETGQRPCTVLLWDNGSSDGTVDALRDEFPEIVAHHHSENLGVASGRNAAAELAFATLDPTHLLFLDNDMLVEPGFVDGLLQPLLQDERVGQTQAKLRFMYDRQRLNDGGGCRINFLMGSTKPVGYMEVDRGQYDRPRPCVACGGAMMVRAELFRQLGGFDSKFDPFGPEDLDFSLRLQRAGYVALYAPAAMAYHEVSHTFGEGYSEQYARHKSRHWFTFMRRHASPLQKAGFFLIGAPYSAIRLVVREGRKGNFGAVRGIARGIADFVKSSLRAR